MRILTIGECMLELAPSDEAGAFRLGFAGDTFNTAWYLAQIAPELRVGYLTAVGDDEISHDMRAFMRGNGISDTHVQTIRGRTVGLYLIHLSGGERSFSYWRDSSAARQLAADPERLRTAMADADLIYFSGITLAILDPESRERLLAEIGQARASGKTIAFDTNLRPRLWANPEEMKATITHAAAQADIVLPSFDDEAEWFGDAHVDDTLKRYAWLGVNRIVVKNSAQSVFYEDHGRRGCVEVDAVRTVVDTTAAGDSFNAGVLASLMRGEDLADGIRAGCHLAGRVVRQKGALVPVGNDGAASVDPTKGTTGEGRD